MGRQAGRLISASITFRTVRARDSLALVSSSPVSFFLWLHVCFVRPSERLHNGESRKAALFPSFLASHRLGISGSAVYN